MSYCQFQNILADLLECYEALCSEQELSKSERKSRDELIVLCIEIAAEFGADEIIETEK